MTSTAADVPTVSTVSDDSDFTAGDGAKAGCRPEAVGSGIPAEAFSPGIFLRDEMDERGWGINDLVAHMPGDPAINQFCVELILLIPDPDIRLDEKTANALSGALGTSPEYWMNLDRAYRDWMRHRVTKVGTPAAPLSPAVKSP